MQRSIPTGRGLRSGPICDLLNTGVSIGMETVPRIGMQKGPPLEAA